MLSLKMKQTKQTKKIVFLEAKDRSCDIGSGHSNGSRN